MKRDDVLMAIAAINYKELEIDRMIKCLQNPQKVEDYYPKDPFEGLTDDEIQAIIEKEE